MYYVHPQQYEQILGNLGYPWRFTAVRVLDKLEDYPWIRSAEHLKEVNKYRKRVGQRILEFNDDDMADLILLGDSKL